MVQKLFEEYVFIYSMAGLCLLGILLKIMVSRTYKRLIKASDNMGSTKHKLMKLMKMKFEACYKLKIGVNNVDSFVDKYVYKHKVCGIHLYTWENLGGQLLVLCLLVGTVSSVLGLAYECGKEAILFTFFTGVLTSSLLIIFESFINLSAKKNVLKANISDYLENFLKVRLEQENFTPEVLEQYRREYFNLDESKESRKAKKKEEKEARKAEKAEKAIKQVASNEIVEDKYTKTRRMVEQLKAEEEALRKEREKEKQRKIKEQEEQKLQPVKDEIKEEKKIENSVDYKIENKLESNVESKEESKLEQNVEELEEEDMRFLIKTFMDTAASKEEGDKTGDFTLKEVKEDRKVSSTASRKYELNESEEKIIEDILKEFLA
jgi:hypothetical protein